MNALSVIEKGDSHQADLSVVLIHGWLDNAASFDVLLQSLSAQRPDIHFCAIDLPGHGLSPHKGEQYFYPFHDYLDDLHQFLGSLATQSHLLIGHSLGGLISSCYSAVFPENVVGLIQIEGKGPLSESADAGVSRLRKGLENRTRIRKKERKGYSSFEKALAHKSKSVRVHSLLIEPIVRRGIERVEDIWYWRADPTLSCQSLYRMSDEHAQNVLDNIHCPYQIILGEQGFSHLQESFPLKLPEQCAIDVVAGGHYCHLESSQEVGLIIVDFINKVEKIQRS